MITPFDKDGERFESPEHAAEFFSEDGAGKGEHIGDLEAYATTKGYIKSHKEFIDYMNQFSVVLTKLRIRSAVSELRVAVQMVSGIEEVDTAANTLYERLDEIYDVYFPEANRRMGIREMADVLSEGPERDRVAKELGMSSKSMGVDVEDDGLEVIQNYASSLKKLLDLREEMVEYVEEVMEERCENLSEVCGPMLAAELISIAGSLKKLARMPSSTIQLLGAEKALFRHLKTGAKPPKHGVIIKHPLVAQSSNPGRMARALASKAAIAAKVDFYGGDFVGDELKEDLEDKQ